MAAAALQRGRCAPHAQVAGIEHARETSGGMTPSIVIAAGGTGGHLLPALAIADAIKEAQPRARITFVGTDRTLDHDLIPRAGYRSLATTVRPITRNARGVLAPFSLVPATAQARAIVRAEHASVVIGMGGYASIPVVAAARMMRIPSIIHEANAIPGLANELCALLTPNIAVSFERAMRSFKRRAPRWTGMPLRKAIEGFNRTAIRAEALEAFKLDPLRTTVLAFGGSLGASRINRAVIALSQRWRDRTDVQILLASGRSDDVGSDPPVLRVVPFIDKMERGYAVADIVVARAGGSTVAELAVVGLPSVLVPLPIARRREQDLNARVLGGPGGAIVIDDDRLDATTLARALDPLIADPEHARAMGRRAHATARTGAAAAIATWALELAESSDG